VLSGILLPQEAGTITATAHLRAVAQSAMLKARRCWP